MDFINLLSNEFLTEEREGERGRDRQRQTERQRQRDRETHFVGPVEVYQTNFFQSNLV